MRTIEEVRDRCFIDDEGHWIWRGAVSSGIARVYAPDWTTLNGGMRSQAGRRGVWHIENPGKALPKGWRVFATCKEPLCLNPKCAKVGTAVKQGATTTKLGKFKNQPKRILANRMTAKKLTRVTPELAAEILSSNEGHTEFQRRTGIGRETVRRVRNGRAVAYQPLGGMFSGLIREAA